MAFCLMIIAMAASTSSPKSLTIFRKFCPTHIIKYNHRLPSLLCQLTLCFDDLKLATITIFCHTRTIFQVGAHLFLLFSDELACERQRS